MFKKKKGHRLAPKSFPDEIFCRAHSRSLLDVHPCQNVFAPCLTGFSMLTFFFTYNKAWLQQRESLITVFCHQLCDFNFYFIRNATKIRA